MDTMQNSEDDREASSSKDEADDDNADDVKPSRKAKDGADDGIASAGPMEASSTQEEPSSATTSNGVHHDMNGFNNARPPIPTTKKKNTVMNVATEATADAAATTARENTAKTAASAPTAGRPPRAAAAARSNSKHDRTISWGATTFDMPAADAVANSNNRRRLSSLSSVRRLAPHTLSQVNPLEQEAETHIISSLEEMEARNEARLRGGVANNNSNNNNNNNKPEILEFVPHGAEGVFLDDLESTFTVRSELTATATAANDAPSSVGAQTDTSSAGGGHNSVHMMVDQEPPSIRSAHERRAAADRGHRRTKTVEEDLFTLTNALNAIHRANHLTTPGVGAPHAAAKANDSAATAANRTDIDHVEQHHPDQAVGSADLLAANAALLFRRKRSQKVLVDADGHMVTAAETGGEGTEQGNTGTDQNGLPHGGQDRAAAATTIPSGKSRWNMLQAVVHAGNVMQNHHKKTDDENSATSVVMDPPPLNAVSSVSVDIEEGGGAAAAAGSNTPPSTSGNDDDDDVPYSSGGPNNNVKRKKPMLKFLQGRSVVVRDIVKQQRVTSLISLGLLVPLIGIAFILFYLCGNPPIGVITYTKDANGTVIGQDPIIYDPAQPSHSWWLLFTARQLVTFALARASEVLVIDIFCLRLRWINVFRSPLLTLLFVQSRGWPFRATAWAIYDLALLHGDGDFARHWMFYQDFLRIFNESNPSGFVTSEKLYSQVIFLFLTTGLATSFKRVFVGYMQGKRVFATYGEEVAAVMRKVLLISQVGILARDIEVKYFTARNDDEARLREDDIWEKVEQFVQPSASDDDTSKGPLLDPVLDPAERDELTGSITQSQRMKIIEMLGDWEDPDQENGIGEVEHNISVTSILQFRQSLAFFDARDMFGYYWGPTDTRVNCIQSSEEVYQRLLYRSNRHEVLSFHVLAMLALNSDGTLKQKKMKELIKIFRPQRDGSLSTLDFVKSVDTVYKKMKLLRASIKKTQRLDQAVERIFNIGFYVIVGVIALAVVGIDPMALFLSLSSIILAFAFMIGAASAKYFEGLLFILVRKPYGVGDRVFFNAPDNETSPDGSAGWFVRDITLYHTTLVYSRTNEYCTVSNGSLANLRVINAARSPKGVLHIYLKFGTEVPWSKIQVFEKSLRAFVKSRPREWLGINGFRTTRVESDLGFHEMVVVLQHRESWQNVASLLVSKAEVTAFCHELQKKMEMRYKSPPLPVDLTVNSNQNSSPFINAVNNDKDNGQAVVAKFVGTSSPAGPAAGEAADASAATGDFDSVAKLFQKKNDS